MINIEASVPFYQKTDSVNIADHSMHANDILYCHKIKAIFEISDIIISNLKLAHLKF